MKTSIQVKQLNALPSGVVQVTHATATAIPKSSLLPTPESLQTDRGIHEMLHRRYTTPFPVVLPYHHSGLNE